MEPLNHLLKYIGGNKFHKRTWQNFSGRLGMKKQNFNWNLLWWIITVKWTNLGKNLASRGNKEKWRKFPTLF